MAWRFRTKNRDEKIRNPIQGEFFATDAIEGPAQALVRESVQNSLDARTGIQPVKVRIFLSAERQALAPSLVERFFKDAWIHYHAERNGLRTPPVQTSPCKFLVVEDFGTKGLIGDPSQADPTPNSPNPFCLFFRAEGLSMKVGTELGRWGVGKFVFPRSSQVSTHFGLTVRSDDKRALLMGASTLKAHHIPGYREMFSPDGLFGEIQDDGFVMPIEDPIRIQEFERVFSLTRDKLSGLSVVVPFVDPEITFKGLLAAVVRDYFIPIVRGQLEVELESGDEKVVISQSSLSEVVEEADHRLDDSTIAFVRLAQAAQQLPKDSQIVLNAPASDRAPRWNSDLVSSDALAQLKAQLKTDTPLSVRVPIQIREKSGESKDTFFEILLVRDKKSDGRPLFAREGIVISDVRGKRTREVRAIVLIESKPLASMLGDSENPAHTQWQKDSSNFRGKYSNGPTTIDFVSGCVAELFAIIANSEQEADPTLTVDFFSLDLPDEEDEIDTHRERSAPRKGPERDKPIVEIPQKPSAVRIFKIAGGFSLKAGSAPPQHPFVLEIRCAYDVRSGNPLKKWNPADFDLTDHANSIVVTGAAEVRAVRGNSILLQVMDASFAASVTGFDLARDVYVRVKVHNNDPEEADASPQA